METWGEYIERHQHLKLWTDSRLAKEMGVEPASIRAWKSGRTVHTARIVSRAYNLFRERWDGLLISDLGWLLVDLQEEFELPTSTLIRRGASKKVIQTLRNGGHCNWHSLVDLLSAYRLPRARLSEVLYQSYHFILVGQP